jgi:anti-sigma factor RsiW
MTCAQLDEVAAELALDLLPGEERATAVAHIEGCERCRRRLVELTAAADRLVGLAPPAEPSPGFEQRVLAAIAPTAAPPAIARRRRPVVIGAVAAAAVAVVVVLAALVTSGTGGSGQRETAMVAPSGAEVGDVYVHDGDPAWLLVAVPEWADRWGGKPYTVRVTQRDGTVTDLAGGDLAASGGTWGSALPVDASAVRSVALLSADGRVWCTGTFT